MEPMMTTPKPTTIEIPTEDVNILALALYFITKESLPVTIDYRATWSGRISGVMIGPAEALARVERAFQTNEAVNCRDLIEAIRTIRTKIFSTKQNMHDRQHSDAHPNGGSR
jgi:hypothetical protein